MLKVKQIFVQFMMINYHYITENVIVAVQQVSFVIETTKENMRNVQMKIVYLAQHPLKFVINVKL